MRRTVLAPSLSALLVVLCACGSSETPTAPSPPGESVRSSLARDTSPDVPPGDLDALVAGDTAFAADLYGALRRRAGNLFYSPQSISLALAMTFAGARGETEAEMARVLHFDLPQARLHPAFDRLDLALASRAGDVKPDGGEPFRLEIVNALFGQRGYAFLAPFLDTLALYYGAGVQLMDFEADPERCRREIDAWVAERTEDRIEDLLPEGSLDVSTRLVLTNAVYFKAGWAVPFDPEETTSDAFLLADGTTASVPTMHGPAGDLFLEGPGFRAAALPYGGEDLDMVLVVPDDLAAFEAGLDGARLEAVLGGLAPRPVQVSLPRFGFRSALDLGETLRGLGMILAFDDADLSGMDGTRRLAVSGVHHQAFVAVDEKGTEAAAATAVVVGEVSVPDYAVLVADRPFLFVIRDRPTGAVLFVGRVVDPR